MIVLDVASNPASAISQAVACLRAGGLIIFPTETTYGAGVDATNAAAVAQLLRFKARRQGKPLSIAVTDQTMAEAYVDLTEAARHLYHQFLPGPVTVVSRVKSHPQLPLAPGVASEFQTVGVRIPDYPLVHQLINQLGRPITATSANASGGKRPYTIADSLEKLSAKQRQLIDLVLDAGQLPPNPPSTVIDTTHQTPLIFRQGASLQPSDTATHLTTHSPEETQQLAGKLLLKYWNQLQTNGLVIGLDGSLGAGKTIFTKGLAAFLGITDPITSPTYTYVETYDFRRHQTAGTLSHLDVWKIESAAELDQLEVSQLWGPQQVVVIEWWSQVESWLKPSLTGRQSPALIQVTMTEPDNQTDRSTFETGTRHLTIIDAQL